MSDLARRPMRADAERNRARILEAAEMVLAAQGLGAPIDEIARTAGVGIGTVYRHFPTKEALFEGIAVGRVQRLVDEARALADGEDPGAALFVFVSSLVEAGSSNKALVDGMAGAGFDVKAARSSVRGDLDNAADVLLTRAQGSGAVRDDVRIADLMLLLMGACLAMAHADSDPELRQRSLAILCDGLRPTGHRLPGSPRPRPSRRRTSGTKGA